jgi:hypothetical protein
VTLYRPQYRSNMSRPQFCPRCHAGASRRYCHQCGLDLQPHKPAISSGDVRAARDREREWLATATATPATVEADDERRASSDAISRMVYWAQRARFLEHLLREALAQAEALHAQCRAAGVTDDEIRQQAGALPRWSASPATAPMARREAPPIAGGFVVGGFYAETGPDADADGDVDGGLFDKLDQLFDG